jgi:predicted XRE-type DNA-binding protein
MAKEEKIELVHGSGNVFRDFGDPDADVRQAKALLAANVIAILDDSHLSTRKAQSLTGIDQSDFSRIRNAQLDRFTIDRLMTILNKFDRRVDIKVTVHPVRPASGGRQSGASAGH